jgi:hypothetical protein
MSTRIGTRRSNRRRIDVGVSGHSSLDQLQEYLNEVDQEHLAEATMTKLSNGRAIKRKHPA